VCEFHEMCGFVWSLFAVLILTDITSYLCTWWLRYSAVMSGFIHGCEFQETCLVSRQYFHCLGLVFVSRVSVVVLILALTVLVSSLVLLCKLPLHIHNIRWFVILSIFWCDYFCELCESHS